MKILNIKTLGLVAIFSALGFQAIANTSQNTIDQNSMNQNAIGQPTSDVAPAADQSIGSQPSEAPKTPQDRARNFFSGVDIDQNGAITEDEFSAVGIQDTFNEIDTNEDGLISQKEIESSSFIQSN